VSLVFINGIKSDFRLSRNLLKGQVGDEINVLMVACAWNLKKWMVGEGIFLFLQKMGIFLQNIRNFWLFLV